MTIAERLAEFVCDEAATDLETGTSRRVQAFVLDTLSVAAAARDEGSTASIRRALLEPHETGSEATVIGSGRRASAEVAALINGTMAHALELDDDHRYGTVHPGAVVVPAALAAAEAWRASGPTFLRSVLLGYEVMCRVGEAFMGRQFYRGFHPTGTCGPFGAAVAVGVIAGLDEASMVDALGIAGSLSAGVGEWRASGAWTKRLHPGRAAQSGIVAARLAAEGFTGPATIFEGSSGFLQAFALEGYRDDLAITRDLGAAWRALLTAFKPYPGCRFAHGAVDLALALRNGITAADVERIDIEIYRTDTLNYEPVPADSVAAQFCLPFLVAAAVVRGQLTLAELTTEALRDERILGLASRVHVTEPEAFTRQYPGAYPTDVTVVLGDGRQRHGFTDCFLGDPESPEYALDPSSFGSDIAAKSRALLAQMGEEALFERLQLAVGELGTARDVTDLAASVRAAAAPMVV